MKDSHFSLDRLTDVRSYVYQNSFMTKYDNKSGYDHVLLTESSQQYFGFQEAKWWLVARSLPFGWKESSFVYHTIGAAVSSFLRDEGIPCSIYIDDRLTGELMRSSDPWSIPLEKRSQAVCLTLIGLGYVLGLSKCVLTPVTSLEFLGLTVDSELQAFNIPPEKLKKFIALRESILELKKIVPTKTLQRFQGKCISFAFAVPAAKLFIRNIAGALSSAHRFSEVNFSSPLRKETTHWRFIDTWTGHVSWRTEKHTRISVESDASGSGWGGGGVSSIFLIRILL